MRCKADKAAVARATRNKGRKIETLQFWLPSTLSGFSAVASIQSQRLGLSQYQIRSVDMSFHCIFDFLRRKIFDFLIEIKIRHGFRCNPCVHRLEERIDSFDDEKTLLCGGLDVWVDGEAAAQFVRERLRAMMDGECSVASQRRGGEGDFDYEDDKYILAGQIFCPGPTFEAGNRTEEKKEEAAR